MTAGTPAQLPIVAVLGSGSVGHEELAVPLGRWLAGEDVHLLTGGGRGVMRSVGRAFSEVRPRAGSVIGVLPGDPATGEPPDGYPNEWVEIPIATHLPLSGDRGTDPMSRNHINVLSGDVLIALPGGSGTASEVRLALGYGKPVVAFVGASGEPFDTYPRLVVCQTLACVQRFVRAQLSGEEKS